MFLQTGETLQSVSLYSSIKRLSYPRRRRRSSVGGRGRPEYCLPATNHCFAEKEAVLALHSYKY